MIAIVLGCVLLLIGLGVLALQRWYSVLPVKELKRLAAGGDRLATDLYRVAAYGASLRLLLWFVFLTTFAGGQLLVLPAVPVAIGFGFLVINLALLAIVWPSLQLTNTTARLAALAASPLAWALQRSHVALDRLSAGVARWRDLPAHSQLYEKEDLLALLRQQREQPDNRIAAAELSLAEQALTFDNKQAADLMQPRGQAHLVNANETIGPVLLNQLHQAGQKAFLVYKDKKEQLVGTLSMHDAVAAKQSGRVLDLTRNDLAFVHEDFSLRDVLTAFQETGQRTLAVINRFEEFVGIITIEAVMKELLSEAAPHELPPFENRRAVAAYLLQPIPVEETDSPTDEPETPPPQLEEQEV